MEITRQLPSRSRAGVTLPELLVVLCLIGFIVSLGFSGIRAAHEAAAEFKNVGEKGKAILAKYDQSEKRRKGWIIPDEYIIKFGWHVTNPKTEADRLASEIEGLEVVHVYTRAFRGMAVRAQAEAFKKLRADKAVAQVERSQVYHATAEVTPVGLPRIKWKTIPLVQNRHPIGNIGNPSVIQDRYRDVVVAIIDTGVDNKHPDLRVTFEKSFITGNPSPADGNGHGTHCAGTVGAIQNTEGVVGIAPGCEIWNLRVLDDAGSGATIDIIAALDFCAQNANRIGTANLSLGGGFSFFMNEAVDNTVRAGVVCCVAAGNDSVDAATASPASSDLAICVAAMADSDGKPGKFGPKTSAGPDDTFADFSNWGDVVDIIAPGVDVLSTINGQTYGVKNGTSMACPHVAGVVGLIRNSDMGHIEKMRNIGITFPVIPGPGPKFTPAEARFALMSAVVEFIPGIFEPLQKPRSYPMLNTSPFTVGMQ